MKVKSVDFKTEIRNKKKKRIYKILDYCHILDISSWMPRNIRMRNTLFKLLPLTHAQTVLVGPVEILKSTTNHVKVWRGGYTHSFLLLRQAEARAEFAERSVQKLQKEVDRLEGAYSMFDRLSNFSFFFSRLIARDFSYSRQFLLSRTIFFSFSFYIYI